jgi:hypothetical protein
MNIQQATKSYENWMRTCTVVVEGHLRNKHQQMRADPFMFFRGTFYRWVQLCPETCRDLFEAPKVLAVGDLHVGSFGTWRDGEGRLCWGVDDFDESYPLPYTNDLVRLAASVKTVIDSQHLDVKLRDGCDAILQGYEQSMKNGGCPIVLAEHENNLEKLGIDAIRPPADFWRKLNERPTVGRSLPRNAKQALVRALPQNLDYKVVQREAGLGSLGQQRFVAIANWRGGFVAREAKAILPSACAWLRGHVGHRQSYYQQILRSAVRSHDPFHRIVGVWLVRRLSPDSNPIEVDDLPEERDEETLLNAMGSEIANVHVGSKRQIGNILKDLRRRKSNWLRSAAKEMAKAIEREWREYKKL